MSTTSRNRGGRKIQNQQIGIDFNKRESHSRHRIYIWVYSNIHLGILLGSFGIYIWVYYQDKTQNIHLGNKTTLKE